MALIEIPNVYNSGTAVSPGRGRFAVIGEPIVAVDLINTAAAPGSPAGDDLLSTDRGAEAWWRIERAHVPPGDLPETRALRRLRSALRDMIGSLVDDRPVLKASVSELNFFMQSAPASTRLSLTAAGLCAETHWHRELGGNPRLAFIATQAAAFLSDPSQVRLAAPMREPGLFDDLHSGQSPAVMVRTRRLRQPSTRRPASPSRRRGLKELRAGRGPACASRGDRAASGRRRSAAGGHRAARPR